MHSDFVHVYAHRLVFLQMKFEVSPMTNEYVYPLLHRSWEHAEQNYMYLYDCVSYTYNLHDHQSMHDFGYHAVFICCH